jgi:hypothetical protein
MEKGDPGYGVPYILKGAEQGCINIDIFPRFDHSLKICCFLKGLITVIGQQSVARIFKG